jgi:hypothetical protein
MGAKELLGGGCTVLATATSVDSNTTPVVFDFGTPNDIYLPGVASGAKQSGDRLALVLVARRTSGTTSICTFTVQDADDTDGGTTIGTPATALTDSSNGLATTATTDLVTVVGVRVQTARPWLRVSFVLDDGTDVFTCQAFLLAFRGGL